MIRCFGKDIPVLEEPLSYGPDIETDMARNDTERDRHKFATVLECGVACCQLPRWLLSTNSFPLHSSDQ